MSTALTRLPGGDPLSAAFPAQLDALRNALNIQGVVHAWPTMAARADDYAATGVLLAHSVFVLDDDPSAVYVTVGPSVEDWARIEEGMPWATIQVRFDWSVERRKSDLKTVVLPVGLFGSRPVPTCAALNGRYADPMVQVTISKDGDDNPSSEITPGQVLCYAYSDPGTELAVGQRRYGYLMLTLRTMPDPA